MVPNGWKLGVISDLADTVMGYAFKSADFTKAGIPLLRMGNLYQNTLSFDRNPIYLPESFKDDYERFLVKPNDLVAILKKYDLRLDSLDGMKFNLIKDEWKISSDKSINYIGKFIKL